MKRYLLFAASLVLFACTPTSQPEQNQKPSGQETNPGGESKPGGETNPGGNTDPGGTTTDFTPEAWYETNYWARSDREKAGLRGPVKKWYLSSSSAHREYEYNEAGNITIIRDVDPSNARGEWMEQRIYDDNNRLIKKIFGRSKEKGGMDFDKWASLEVWTYEYNNPGKYVWVRPDDSFFSSFYAFRKLDPESFSEHYVDMNGTALIMKDLSKIQLVNDSDINTDSRSFTDFEYVFNADGNMEYSYHQYSRAYNIETGEVGDILDSEENYTVTYDNPIVYQNNYPVSGTVAVNGQVLYEISSITWRDNGMPLKMEGPDGITQFDPNQKRYICTNRWDCQPGNPHDALFVFGYWETFKYNEAGDLIEMQERFNEDSDQPWTRPTTWEFEYDSHGNWISYKTTYMIAIDGPNGEVKNGSLKRTIEYY